MIKTKKNLVRSPDEYTRYYGNFRGVDFSSDHTQVNDRRFAYSVNMYKDYRSGEGSAIETIPGFRRRFEAPIYIDEETNGVVHPKINGIHEYENINANGVREKFVLVHAGTRLYRWKDYPLTVNVKQQISLALPLDAFEGSEEYVYDITDAYFADRTICEVIGISVGDIKYTNSADLRYFSFDKTLGKLTIHKTIEKVLGEDGVFNVLYHESTVAYEEALFGSMADAESKSFVFQNDMYIIDGEHYLVFDNEEETVSEVVGYVPTCYEGIPVNPELFSGNIKDYEMKQKNILSDKFIHTYIAAEIDPHISTILPNNEYKTKAYAYPLYDHIGSIDSVSVYDKVIKKLDTDKFDPKTQEMPNDVDLYWSYGVRADGDDYGYILFWGKSPPPPPTDVNKAEDYAGVKITFVKTDELIEEHAKTIKKCTLVAEFDKRIFLSGNPLHPNNVWFCGLNGAGVEDATYFGMLDVVADGVENAPITALMPVADTLAALKNHAKQDGTVYFHKALATESNVMPVTYPSERGLSGHGCLGACVNFLDDPIFISRLGVEAIGQLSVRLERAIEHRSTLIDAKLVNLNLSDAKIAEWDGYLILLVEGRIFMADSRQVYQSENGNMQYEWYYLEGIGVYENQHREYYYSPDAPKSLPSKIEHYDVENDTVVEYETALATSIFNYVDNKSENLLNTPVEADYSESEGDEISTYLYTYDSDGAMNTIRYVIRDTWDGKAVDKFTSTPITTRKAILCEDRGSYTGGEFKPANVIINMDDNLFFGTTNGIVCSFNFDLKTEDGRMLSSSYSFDNRTIYCGIATKMDNCDIPHLNKSTIKKSTVIKTKSMSSSSAKVKIRTNKNRYHNIARLNSRLFAFEDVDFSDFSFATNEQTIFAIKEKEKHWVEKQHWIYSDEYQKPFSVHYITFRYKVSGRIKE